MTDMLAAARAEVEAIEDERRRLAAWQERAVAAGGWQDPDDAARFHAALVSLEVRVKAIGAVIDRHRRRRLLH